MKSEPDAFGIDDLRKAGTEPWSGVRNYQARNFMRDQMKNGDPAFFYHSNCDAPGIYGLMRVSGHPYPDPTQYDRKSKYFDPKATAEQPRWHMVDMRYWRHLKRPILLSTLREHAGRLRGFKLLAPGSRLSVMPVSPAHWKYVLSLERS